jgi:hypothetical protein
VILAEGEILRLAVGLAQRFYGSLESALWVSPQLPWQVVGRVRREITGASITLADASGAPSMETVGSICPTIHATSTLYGTLEGPHPSAVRKCDGMKSLLTQNNVVGHRKALISQRVRQEARLVMPQTDKISPSKILSTEHLELPVLLPSPENLVLIFCGDPALP